MKVILLYGPGEVSKRSELLKIKKQFAPESISQLDLKQADVGVLVTKLSSPSLFSSGPRLVIAENASEKFSLEGINFEDNNTCLVITAPTLSLSSPLLQSVKRLGAKIYSFEGEKETSAFPYLDSLLEQKRAAFLELEKLLQEYGGIYVLSMIYYLLRRNVLPLPPSEFLQKKIRSQKEKYNLEDFKNLYRLTLETEFKIKSGLMEEKLGLTLLTQTVIEGRYEG